MYVSRIHHGLRNLGTTGTGAALTTSPIKTRNGQLVWPQVLGCNHPCARNMLGLIILYPCRWSSWLQLFNLLHLVIVFSERFRKGHCSGVITMSRATNSNLQTRQGETDLPHSAGCATTVGRYGAYKRRCDGAVLLKSLRSWHKTSRLTWDWLLMRELRSMNSKSILCFECWWSQLVVAKTSKPLSFPQGDCCSGWVEFRTDFRWL